MRTLSGLCGCGAVKYERAAVGTLEESATHAPSVNIYGESMLCWVEQIGSATQIVKGV
jgi:hypothetical protein